MAPEHGEIGTDEVLEQGDALLRSSRDLLADIDRQLGGGASSTPVHKPGDRLRTNDPVVGDS